MVLTAEQEATVKKLCEEIKPGEFGRVTIGFVGSPSNVVQITGEKNFRFHNEKALPTSTGEAIDRKRSGRYER